MADSKAVILDHSVLLVNDAGVTGGLRTLMQALRGHGARLVGFSTHPIDLNARLAQQGLPPVDLLVTRQDVGVSKGSPVWIERTAAALGIPHHHLLYVGDDELDWRTAINAAVLYLHAAWAKPKSDGVTALVASSPAYAYKFITHFFLPPHRWEYRLDDEARGLHVRSLLNAEVRLAATGRTFTLQDVFKYDNNPAVGEFRARDVLMLHAIANLYAEGLICPGCRFVVYPSSTPGNLSPTLAEFLEPAAKTFHGFYKPSLVVRAAQAPDTSVVRAQGGLAHFRDQARTVKVHPENEGKMGGKTVVIFDDFTTSGMSLDWGRTLLSAAGADRVVLVTFGKYAQNHPARHRFHTPRGFAVQPFALHQYEDGHFDCHPLDVQRDLNGRATTSRMFECWSQGQPYPLPQPVAMA
jgi:hypothetical protein